MNKIVLFNGIAELSIKEDWLFDESTGCITPVSDEENWSLSVVYERTGHLKGAGLIDKKTIINHYWYGRFLGSADTAELFRDPIYDHSKHKLSWCVEIFPIGKRTYWEYRELIFCREGYLNVELTCSMRNIESGLIQDVEKATTIMAGNTFKDFDPIVDKAHDYHDFISSFFYYSENHARDIFGRGTLLRQFGILSMPVVICQKTIKEVKKYKKLKKETQGGEHDSYYQKLKKEEERLARKNKTKFD